MPISKNATINHTLMNVVVDIPGAYMLCTFRKDIDGIGQGDVVMRVDGADMLGIIGVPASGVKSRADDITDAVYEYAVSSGAIAGSI